MPDTELISSIAKTMHGRLKQKSVQVRNAFFDVNQRDPDDSHDCDVPPVTQLLQNRSKNGLDLKLELTYLWIGGSAHKDRVTGQAHTIHIDDTDMAHLVGLDKPQSQGKRVIAGSRSRLERLGLISVERPKGKAVTVTLRNESGNGEPYTRPGAPGAKQGKYTSIPREFWTNLWHLKLDGKALASLLVIRHLSEMQGGGVWRSPKERLDRYGFSDDVWYAGINQLLEEELIAKQKILVKEWFKPAPRHYRDTYTLRADRMLSSRP